MLYFVTFFLKKIHPLYANNIKNVKIIIINLMSS